MLLFGTIYLVTLGHGKTVCFGGRLGLVERERFRNHYMCADWLIPGHSCNKQTSNSNLNGRLLGTFFSPEIHGFFLKTRKLRFRMSTSGRRNHS